MTHRMPAQRVQRAHVGAKRGDSVVRAGLFGLGLPEIVVIGGVAAVLFGPSKLPELGKSLGKTVKSFQEAATVRDCARSACCVASVHFERAAGA
jgi:TatA/E family protein of Tat protein translocase